MTSSRAYTFTSSEASIPPTRFTTNSIQGAQSSTGVRSTTGATGPRPSFGQRPSLDRKLAYRNPVPRPLGTNVPASQYFSPPREHKLTFGNLPNRASMESAPHTSHGFSHRKKPVRERAPTPYPEEQPKEASYFKGHRKDKSPSVSR